MFRVYLHVFQWPKDGHLEIGGLCSYLVTFGSQTLESKVRTGTEVTDVLGQIEVVPGDYKLRVQAKEITGEELMRLRAVNLRLLP